MKIGRKLLTAVLLSITYTSIFAQDRDTLFTLESSYSDEFLDTVVVNKQALINDYSMIGVYYGAAMNRMSFQPSKRQTSLMTPVNFGITYTKYGKLFDMMPYFGFTVGLMYGQDGYKFKQYDDGTYSSNVDGATQATYTFIELPFLSHFHADIWKIKLIAEAGLYGGYRLSVQREGRAVDPDYVNSFYPYDRRWDYGAKFGAGIGLVLDPLEIHIKAQYKWSWSNIYEPDYASPYYYRFAYPMDLYFSVGIHYQLQKRYGKTKAQIKKEARKIVFG